MSDYIKIEKSEYEMEFAESRGLETFEYKGYRIYSYISDIGDRTNFTFWTSNKDSDYYSSIKSLEEAKEIIEKIIEKGIHNG